MTKYSEPIKAWVCFSVVIACVIGIYVNLNAYPYETTQGNYLNIILTLSGILFSVLWSTLLPLREKTLIGVGLVLIFIALGMQYPFTYVELM